MRLGVGVIVVAASASLLAGPAQARSEQCRAVNEAEITALFDQFNAAWATKNPDTVTALFGPDATLLPTVSNVKRSTKEGIRDYFVKFLQSSPVGRIDSSTVDLGCNWAARVGNWTVELTDATTGAKSEVKARYSFFYKYQNGRWMIDHLHSSVLPPNS